MKTKMTNYSLKLSPTLKERLDALSKNLSKPKSAIVREAIEAYLNEIEDFSSAVNALEELKDGDYKKASKEIDKLVKNLKETEKEEEMVDFDFAVKALEELKDGDYKKASKEIDKIVKNLKNTK
ncbi:ribbon-helix-helix domain-containing protein [Campylobacter upsaliensis]|uniref:Ribbon-helix-helix protein, copG family domain protein n=2 Tax=Campylobacter upsaliensis TaxID=28080 RepID=A0A828QZG9_CAMUP|nr:ribbon-helix-helix domain-containing protein [Campylobacter upsaliensis]EFU71895.1 Ribbon-helix-helix protein, copG family domain protein [Campylobacter upsaliensis JV21]QKF87889.1 putative transcriptional regulator [Campylobacter upsaliensis RM3940]EAH4720469.1 ribbon-helix-helix domain-containing protein [Campylobacter upsaliensis]EAH5217822.1 ribbon-helix-helix domain-containing protein [Campylobacter upsaliensis]